MAITKAEIFQRIHERLKRLGLARRVINIDDDLLDCLYELSNDINVLVTSTTVTTTAGTVTVTKPTGMQHIFVAAVDGGNVLEPGSMDEYEKSIEDLETVPTGSPTKIFEFGGNLYIYGPVPDAAYTVRIYGVLEEDDVDDIDLHDRCREALCWGVLYRLFIGGELDPNPEDELFERKMLHVGTKKGDCLAMYERAKAALRRSEHKEPILIKYRDV